MKIAFVNHPLDRLLRPFRNSLGIWTYETGRRLARSHDVIVYGHTKKTGRDRNRFQKKIVYDEGVHYQLMPTAYNGFFLRLFRRLPRSRNAKRPMFASSLYHFGYAFQVATDLRKQKCDIVHILNYSQFVPVIRAFNPKIKIVLMMHCEWLTQLDRTMIEQRLRHADLAIGCSEYITEKIRRRFPHLASRCQTVYDGVDIHRFTSKSDRIATKNNGAKRLLFVGRVSPEKGLHVLLDAFQKVVLRCPQAELEIVGGEAIVAEQLLVALSDDPRVKELTSFYRGSYFSHLRDKLPLWVATGVHFTGLVPNTDVVNYYRNSDVLINPSFSESFGMSLAEAMACKVPVVATRVGGMTEIVDEGKTGLLVDPGDAEALAEAILCLLSNEDMRKSMGKAGRKRVAELFSWERIAENLLSHYKNLLRSHV